MNHVIRPVYLVVIAVFFTSCLNVITAPAATVSTLTNLATACSSLAKIPNDFGGYMQNYVEQHFSASATRLGSCCNMTNATFTGTSADAGVILGIENNTLQRFSVMQNGVVIDALEPGMNDIALHLASLISSTGTTSTTSDITFVPYSGAQSSKVRVRVLSGAQLSAHIANLSTAQGVTFLKNGNNPLPGAGQLATTSTDQYLVVETVSLSSTTPLPGAEQRIQVLNLSNITKVYTLSLEINLMGLVFEAKGTVSGASTPDQVVEYASLKDTYLASIKNVHILDEVQGHVVPLLVLPKHLLHAGTALNVLYVTYIQSYSNYIAGKNAGAAKEYYDLMINYCLEPYGYLHALHYFDMDKSLLAVVDQSANLSSGIILGGVIGTDVYAPSLALSSDLSLVKVSSSGSTFDLKCENLIFGFDIDSMKNKNNTHLILKATGPDLLSKKGVLVPFPSNPDLPSKLSLDSFPSNSISTAFFNQMPSNQLAIHWICAPTWAVVEGGIVVGDPTSITTGVSYNSIGGFPSAFWSLTQEDWVNGIHLVPVMYDSVSFVELLNLSDLNKISTASPAALYFYAFKAKSGKFIGLIPVQTGPDLLETSQYSTIIQFYLGINSMYQSPTYSKFGVATPGMTGLVPTVNKTGNNTQIDYPGDCYLTYDLETKIVSSVRNKMPDFSSIITSVEKAWSIDNGDGSDKWMISVPKSAVAKGLSVHINKISSQNYEIVLKDKLNNILGFRQFTTSETQPTLMMNRIDSSGQKDWASIPVKLTADKNVFDVKGSGKTLKATSHIIISEKQNNVA